MELDKQDRGLDEFGYEIVLGEFSLDPDKHKLEKVKYTTPLELEETKGILEKAEIDYWSMAA